MSYPSPNSNGNKGYMPLPPSGYRHLPPPPPPPVNHHHHHQQQQQQQQQQQHQQQYHSPNPNRNPNYNPNYNHPQYQTRPSPQQYEYQNHNQQAQYWNQNRPQANSHPHTNPHTPLPQPHSNLRQTPHSNPNPPPNPNVNTNPYGMNGYSNGGPSTYQRPSPAPIRQTEPYQKPQQSQQPQQPQQPQSAQFISPSQLFHQAPHTQPLPAQPYQQDPIISHTQSTVSPAFLNPSSMGPMASNTSEPDLPSLLIALAEEYFSTAHQLAPSISISLDDAETEVYASLISTGLGCLATAIERVKMSPRLEAQVRLRYAGVLFQETNNHTDAEMVLSQGIALCEMNHYYDLKYAMQFLLAQVLAKSNIKASLKALESHATEAQTLHHFSWVYAFRFLRASYSLECGGQVDIHAAVQNLRGIAAVATQQQDYTIHMTASLLEAMAYMKSTASDAVQNVQSALARAWSHQTNVRNATQLIGLAHFTQVACSIRQGNPTDMRQKLQAMQTMMDAMIDDESWSNTSGTIAIPINRTASSSQTVSSDTRMVLGIGEDGRDNLMLSFLSLKDAYSINYLFCGMIYLRRNPQDLKAVKFFEQALKGDTQKAKPVIGLLPDLLGKQQWRGQVTCYLRVYLAFQMAIIGDWKATKLQIDELMNAAKEFDISLENGLLGILSLYLKGVLFQGTGQFDAALEIYEDKKFNLTGSRTSSLNLSNSMERDVCILASLNRISILQVEDRRNINQNVALIQALEPFCSSHPSQEIQTAYHLVLATVRTNPEAQIFETKRNLKAALQGSQATGNQLFTCITLNVMCSKFFTGVVGPQAEKSAQAAAVTATKTGNPLWRSVAEGSLGRCYEVQGKTGEGAERLRVARSYAQKAFPST